MEGKGRRAKGLRTAPHLARGVHHSGGVTARAQQSLGKQGEDLACRELERLGYAVVARRYRTRFGEIDIVCERRGVIAFVEVKARRHDRFGSAAEAIPAWKQRRIGAMALDYLAWVGRLNAPCQFAVVAIDGIGTADETVRVIEDAFSMDT
jgi:putative endonuclease